MDGDSPAGRSFDRRLQELRSENRQQMTDLDKQVKEDLASLRGWVDAAIVAVISRLGLLERGQQASASARGRELKPSEPQQSTEGQPLPESCKAGEETSAASTTTCSSSLVTRSSCEGRSFSSGRQPSMGPGVEAIDISTPVGSEGSSMVIMAAPSPGSHSQRVHQGLARSSQSQSALAGQASAGMALPQPLSLSPRKSWAYVGNISAASIPLVLPTCNASGLCGSSSGRVRSCGPPHTARASFGIASTATATAAPNNGPATPKVGGNVATSQVRTS